MLEMEQSSYKLKKKEKRKKKDMWTKQESTISNFLEINPYLFHPNISIK